MEITFVLTDVKEIDADFADFLFENGFDDCTRDPNLKKCSSAIRSSPSN
jgi:hypothetical protein